MTLVVSGISNTKEDAIAAALRSAIEQTYGAFVSSNTTILNDDLIKDEIVTISQGNIQSYKELSCVNLANGKIEVQLQATVSISRLVSYAQSKGASAELAGATFGMNMQMYELNKKNELTAILNLYESLSRMTGVFDYKLDVDGPYPDSDSQYKVVLKVRPYPNKQTEAYFTMLYSTLRALSITNKERKNYQEMHVKYYRYIDDEHNCVPDPVRGSLSDVDRSASPIYLRNSPEELPGIFGGYSTMIKDVNGGQLGYANTFSIRSLLYSIFSKISISDNLSHPYSSPLLTDNPHIRIQEDQREVKVDAAGNSKFNLKKPYGRQQYDKGDNVYIEFSLYIPKKDIAKYNNFQVIEL